MEARQLSYWESERLRLDDAIDLSLASLKAYGARYRHWGVAYSGGKDSSAAVTLIAWAIKQGLVPAPESLTVLYADTRMELPPLQQTAMKLLQDLQWDGIETQIVSPPMDSRFMVYMLGRGVPPPKNRFRWCTPKIKVEPMLQALQSLRAQAGEKILMITGVRLGESAARDQRIALSCSKDSGECGQGWFQISTDAAIADTLAPIVHWRLCHVYDWLYFEQSRHGYDVSGIAAVYGDGEVRTGCAGCNLTSRDVALERLIKHPEWGHLEPLLELKPLYRELTKAKNRLRKDGTETRKDGTPPKNAQRLGPLTMKARAYGLARILDIQQRARVNLINSLEEQRIRDLWQQGVWPEGWTGQEMVGDRLVDAVRVSDAGLLTVQSALFQALGRPEE